MSYPYPYPGPISPENNPRVHPEYFQPSRFVISALSIGLTTLVTTSVDHNYVIGQRVRLLVPVYYGTFQINEEEAVVISIPASNEMVLDINSINYNAFIPNPAFGPTKPQILAIGDVNTGAINAQGRMNQAIAIPGSFINISPL